MNRRILNVCALIVALLCAAAAHAQAPSAFPYAFPVPNDAATGTTQFTLTKINSSGNAVIMASTDTNGYAGVCVSNCGKVGTAWIAFAGLVPLTMENTTTAQHYVQIGSTTGGDGHDSGAATYPTTGGDVIGRVQVGAAAAAQAMVLLDAETSVVPLNVTTTTIASGTAALGTSAIASAACATVVTVSATGVATTDVVTASFNGDPTAVTGYVPLTTGMLAIIVYPTANNINVKVCNNTSASITPGAITLNWKVVR